MIKNVVPLPPRRATPTKTVSGQRVVIRLGKQRYALDITCQASVLPPELEPASRLIETKFLRLRQPATLGDRIDGWRVCWLGGWDRGRLFYVVMVERAVPRPDQESRQDRESGTFRCFRLSLMRADFPRNHGYQVIPR